MVTILVFNANAFIQQKQAKQRQGHNKSTGNDISQLNINIRHAYQPVSERVNHVQNGIAQGDGLPQARKHLY